MSVKAKSLKNYQVKINVRGHEWVADEPLSVGGDDTGPFRGCGQNEAWSAAQGNVPPCPGSLDQAVLKLGLNP